MKITSMSAQVKNPDRVSICVDGKYGFSLEISQVVELGIKIGNEIDELDLEKYKKASDYGKIYFKALVYSLSRPHSIRELELYLMKKNLDSPIVFLERSLYSDKNVFMKNFAINGVAQKAEIEVYD
jgi:regulatory protein